MSEINDYRSPGGLTIDDLARSSRALIYMLDEKPPCSEWDTFENEKKDKWRKVASIVAEQCAGEIECSWLSLTERCHAAYHPGVIFEEVLPKDRLIWEAIARNLVNMATIEEMRDLHSAEAYWKSWYKNKNNGEEYGEKVEQEDDVDDDGYRGSRYG